MSSAADANMPSDGFLRKVAARLSMRRKHKNIRPRLNGKDSAINDKGKQFFNYRCYGIFLDVFFMVIWPRPTRSQN